MAAVTVNSAKYNVAGSLRDQYYSITGSTADTLTVGLNSVKKVNTSAGSLITAVATAAGATGGTTVLTFTSSAPMVAEVIQVLGN